MSALKKNKTSRGAKNRTSETSAHKRCVDDSISNVLNAIHCPALVLDEYFRIKFANSCFCSEFKMDLDAIKNQLVYELGNHSWDIPVLRVLIENAVSSPTAPKEVETENDFPGVGKRSIRLRVKEIAGSGAKNRRILLTVEDITEHKQVENRLKKAAYEWRRTFDSISDPIFLLDNDFTLVRANKAFFNSVDIKPQDMKGKKCYELMHENHCRADNCPVKKMNQDKKTHFEEVKALGSDPYLVTVSPVLDEDQSVVGVVHISKNISKLKKAEERMLQAHRDLKTMEDQLAQSEKLAAVGQLVAGVAHEINNPVGFVAGNLEVLRHYVGIYLKLLSFMVRIKEAVANKDWDKVELLISEVNRFETTVNLDYLIEDSEQLLTQSQDGMGRIEKIVGELKTFALEEAQGKDEMVRVEDVLDKVLGIMRSKIQSRIEVRKIYSPTASVCCNKHKIGQVFMNILINALHSIEGKGVIEIATGTSDGCVRVAFRDSGCGIPEENLSRLFSPFFTTKPAGVGTGLGLSISHNIVKKYGGEIHVESQVGKGSCFTVSLPVPEKR